MRARSNLHHQLDQQSRAGYEQNTWLSGEYVLEAVGKILSSWRAAALEMQKAQSPGELPVLGLAAGGPVAVFF
ncbi:MAG TPA: hypothetical protein VGY99_19765 [Candidatus Binataceae bacterium]|nr:hypothetical protein [Candidatus Binataceae bacterium]